MLWYNGLKMTCTQNYQHIYAHIYTLKDPFDPVLCEGKQPHIYLACRNRVRVLHVWESKIMWMTVLYILFSYRNHSCTHIHKMMLSSTCQETERDTSKWVGDHLEVSGAIISSYLVL